MYLNINGVTTKHLFNDTGTQHKDALSGTQSTSINVMDTTGNKAGIEADSQGITKLLEKIDNALTIVTTERAKLGAAQNRLEYTSNSLLVSSENLSSAESRIRNTDMAKEMMKLTQANVIQQAAVSMLAQANQQPQSILQLLQ
jgi:flagellin